MTKVIGENIYLLGYTGSLETVIHISNKIFEMYGEISSEVLESVFFDYLSGKTEIKCSFNISHITIGLRNIGILTKKEKDTNGNGPRMVY